MERNKGFLLVVISLWLLPAVLSGQNSHRFMVFFQDKNSSFSVDNPSEFLSQKALDRRSRQNIEITEEDLPVNPGYVATVKDQGIQVWYPTRWLNGILIQTDSSQLPGINALPFVTSIEYVAPGPLVPQSGKFRSKKNRSKDRPQTRTSSTDSQNQLLGVDVMHDSGISGQGMLIAVFDGGFEGVNNSGFFSHLYNNDQLLETIDFVGNSDNVYRYDDHGTKVLSVIAASDPGGYSGTAFEADFMLCVTEDVSSEYRIEEYNWLFAAEMADSAGADIINTSLGYNTFDDPKMNYDVDDLDGQTAVISQAASIAATKGMVLTISAGNSGNSLWGTITAPADAFNVLAVGAITADSSKATFSSTGPSADGRIKPEVVALGVGTSVINSSGNIVSNNGTSFSAPQIAGLAAGFWQANPHLNYLQVIAALKNSGSQAQTPDNELGFGFPNYGRASDLVLSVSDISLNGVIKLFPNPFGDNLYLVSELPFNSLVFTMHNASGQKIAENELHNIPAALKVPVEIPSLTNGIYLVTLFSDRQASTFRLIKY